MGICVSMGCHRNVKLTAQSTHTSIWFLKSSRFACWCFYIYFFCRWLLARMPLFSRRLWHESRCSRKSCKFCVDSIWFRPFEPIFNRFTFIFHCFELWLSASGYRRICGVFSWKCSGESVLIPRPQLWNLLKYKIDIIYYLVDVVEAKMSKQWRIRESVCLEMKRGEIIWFMESDFMSAATLTFIRNFLFFQSIYAIDHLEWCESFHGGISIRK